jgi:alanine-glyoxylate transaminase/serine-glyoxylate transaminase/serine-pyruvate transaminase
LTLPNGGRHFLQIPGPTNVPDRVLRAMDRAVIDHRGPDIPEVMLEVVERLRALFKTIEGEVAVWPASGTGAWEAAVVNTLSPGDRVLALDNGFFANRFAEVARTLGVEVDQIALRWGDPVTAADVGQNLRPEHRAVLVVHNETSTGATTDLAAVRHALDDAGSKALLLVDTVSGLGSMDLRFDEWGLDVALTGSQKGLMLPPGLGLCCLSRRALEASESNTMRRHFYDWRPIVSEMRRGYYPFTPPTLELFGLREALRMLDEEGLDAVFERHRRLAEGVRRAVEAWDRPLLCRDEEARSNSLTAIEFEDVDTNQLLQTTADRLNLSLGGGLARLNGRVLRIGHLGALNELEVLATLSGVEMGLRLVGASVTLGSGVAAAQDYFTTG